MKILITSYRTAAHAMELTTPSIDFMPPVRLSQTGDRLLPDFAALLFADKIVMDGESYVKRDVKRDVA